MTDSALAPVSWNERDLELFTINDVSRLTKLTRRTIQNEIREGRLRTVRVGRRSIRITRTELERYISEPYAP